MITGDPFDEERSKEFVKDLFKEITVKKERPLLVKYTQTTDIDDFQTLITFLTSIITREIIQKIGLF